MVRFVRMSPPPPPSAAALRGRRVLLTRAAEDNGVWSARLKARGLVPATLACVRCEPAEDATVRLMQALEGADWLVLGSGRAARCATRALGNQRLPGLRVATVGAAATAEARGQLGGADHVVGDGAGRALGVELAASLPRSARVVVAGGGELRSDVDDVLRPVGIEVRRVEVYRSLPANARRPKLRLADLALDAVFVASPPAVVGLRNQADLPEGVPVIALGPATAAAAGRAGLRVDAQARARGLDGMIAALAGLEPGDTTADAGADGPDS